MQSLVKKNGVGDGDDAVDTVEGVFPWPNTLCSPAVAAARARRLPPSVSIPFSASISQDSFTTSFGASFLETLVEE